MTKVEAIELVHEMLSDSDELLEALKVLGMLDAIPREAMTVYVQSFEQAADEDDASPGSKSCNMIVNRDVERPRYEAELQEAIKAYEASKHRTLTVTHESEGADLDGSDIDFWFSFETWIDLDEEETDDEE